MAQNCPNEDDQEDEGQGGEMTMMGQPKEVVMEIQSVEKPEDDLVTPPVPADGDWKSTAHDLKKRRRSEALKLKSMYQQHKCSKTCVHVKIQENGPKRANLSWSQKCAELGLRTGASRS